MVLLRQVRVFGCKSFERARDYNTSNINIYYDSLRNSGRLFYSYQRPPDAPPHFPQRARVESQVCKLYFNLSLIFLLSICIGVLILFICCVHYADCSAALVTWNLYVDNIYYGHLMVFTLDLFMCIYYWANPDLLPRLSTPSLFIQ